MKISDSAKEKIAAAVKQRRTINQERRLCLKILAKAHQQKHRHLRNLPAIRKRKMDSDDKNDCDEIIATDPANVLLQSTLEAPPKAKKLRQ